MIRYECHRKSVSDCSLMYFVTLHNDDDNNNNEKTITKTCHFQRFTFSYFVFFCLFLFLNFRCCCKK